MGVAMAVLGIVVCVGRMGKGLQWVAAFGTMAGRVAHTCCVTCRRLRPIPDEIKKGNFKMTQVALLHKRSSRGKEKSVENFVRCEEIRTKLNMSKSEFSTALGFVTAGGYDASAVREGAASLTILLAAEGLLGRYLPAEVEEAMYLLVTIGSGGKILAAKAVEMEEATIAGQSYLLIKTGEK